MSSSSELYTHQDSNSTFVLAAREEGRIKLYRGFPRSTTYNPLQSFDLIFTPTAFDGRPCCVAGCSNNTGIKTLRGEYLCLEHLDSQSEFLVGKASLNDAVTQLIPQFCPCCKEEGAPTVLDFTQWNTVYTCYKCEQRYTISKITTESVLDLQDASNCERVIIGQGVSRYVDLKANPQIQINDTIAQWDQIISINPKPQPRPQIKDVIISHVSPKHILLSVKGITHKIPRKEFDHFNLCPSYVVAECQGLVDELGNVGYCGNKPTIKARDSRQTQTFVNERGEPLKASLTFLKLFKYFDEKYFAWDRILNPLI